MQQPRGKLLLSLMLATEVAPVEPLAERPPAWTRHTSSAQAGNRLQPARREFYSLATDWTQKTDRLT